MANTARDRAEDLLQNLQKRARELLEAEEGVVQTVKDLVEEKGISAQDARRRLEEVMGRIRTAKVWERIKSDERVVALGDYRDELEKRAEEAVNGVLRSLPVATKADLNSLQDQIKSLNRKVGEMGRSLKEKVAKKRPSADKTAGE